MNSINITPRLQSFADFDKGRRSNNEDYVASYEPDDPKERQANGCVYIVADGVGGASIGERASSFAAKKVLYEYKKHPEAEPALRLKQAIMQTNREIFEFAENRGIRMATTMAVAVVIGNKLIVANVGDSRVYLINKNGVEQITRDHNIVGELLRDNMITEEEALRSKVKNRLTRSIGGNDEVHVDVFDPIQLQPDDKILLCTDGLTRYTLKKDIAGLTASGSPEKIVNDAIAFAKKQGHGGADNISVITVIYEPTSQFEATKKIRRQTSPEESWEIMDTILDIKPRTRSKRVQGMIMALSALVLMVMSGITFYYRDKVLSFIASQFNNQAQLGAVPTASITPDLANTALPSISPTSMLLSDFTLTPEPSPGQAIIVVPATLETATAVLVNCGYTVVQGDNLSNIADRFGIGGKWGEIKCAEGEDNLDCNVSKPEKIQPGWQIIIPNVDQNICVANNGTPK